MEGATVDEVASALTTAVLSTTAGVAPLAQGKIELRGWGAGEEVKREIHVAWEKREEAWRPQRCEPKDLTFRRSLTRLGSTLTS